MICHSVSVVSAECGTAIFPFLGIFVRWIEHSQSRAKRRQDDGWWTEGFMDVDLKFILKCKRSSGQSRRQDWELIQVCFRARVRRWRLVLGLILWHRGIGKSGDPFIFTQGHGPSGLVGHRWKIIL